MPRPLGGLALALTMLLAVVILLSLAAAGAQFSRASTLEGYIEHGSATFLDVQDADDWVGLTAILWLLGVVATSVVFIVWQYRHASNARTLRGRSGLGPGWAIGGWFIPGASLMLPAVEMHQSSQASDPATPGRNGRGSGLIVAWAIVWGIAALIVMGGNGMYPDETDSRFAWEWQEVYEEALASDRVSAVGFVAQAVAGGLAIGMVRSLTTRQEAALAAAGGGSPYGVAGVPPGFAGVPPGFRPPPGYGQPPPPGAGMQAAGGGIQQPPGHGTPASPAPPPPTYGTPTDPQQSPGYGQEAPEALSPWPPAESTDPPGSSGWSPPGAQ